ncbi:tubulin-specific chaperone C-like [Gigantopelta aegis]|uniref:tubulin-specific chaperone C-like n=1 Tax=Gigantopelta aegis TaxID=1735272 RepID=UPI001B88AF00|nr:tubulin-specific chaperone C-like [Gigantopelta aegis]
MASLCENGKNLSDRKEIVTERLKKRKQEREAEVLKRKTEKDACLPEQESTKYFINNFSQERSFIENELSESDKLPKKDLTDHFDSISVRLTKLQSFVTESSLFLTSHDLKVAQDDLQQLQSRIQAKRDELLPKKRFAFRQRKEKKPKPVIDDSDEVVNLPENQNDLMVELAECKFVDRANKILAKNAAEVNLKDVALANLTSCTVKLFGAPSALHVNKLNNCYVFTGPVSGSVFIRDCINCIFVSPCQQLRIHSTTLTTFYIHVTSKAVIEDSNTLFFAPYNWDYPGLEEHYRLSGLDKTRNNWSDVDDFNWLAADAHSPNWSILPEEERVKDWNE